MQNKSDARFAKTHSIHSMQSYMQAKPTSPNVESISAANLTQRGKNHANVAERRIASRLSL
jgi:hypothetical protein